MARKEEVSGGIPEWMCTFGDMMSLLLCFFIMLYSMSIIEEIKYEALVETLNRQFGYPGQSRIESRNTKTSASLSTTSEMSRRSAVLTGAQPTEGKSEFTLVQTIQNEGETVRGGLILFEHGNTELTEQAKQGLETMFPILLASANKIVVQGHSAPAETGPGEVFKRDIDLARARAITAMDYLISLGNLREDFFVIGASDSTALPNRAVLSAALRADPNAAGASVAIYLLKETVRPR